MGCEELFSARPPGWVDHELKLSSALIDNILFVLAFCSYKPVEQCATQYIPKINAGMLKRKADTFDAPNQMH